MHRMCGLRRKVHLHAAPASLSVLWQDHLWHVLCFLCRKLLADFFILIVFLAARPLYFVRPRALLPVQPRQCQDATVGKGLRFVRRCQHKKTGTGATAGTQSPSSDHGQSTSEHRRKPARRLRKQRFSRRLFTGIITGCPRRRVHACGPRAPPSTEQERWKFWSASDYHRGHHSVAGLRSICLLSLLVSRSIQRFVRCFCLLVFASSPNFFVNAYCCRH